MKAPSLIGLFALCLFSSCIKTVIPIPKPPSGGTPGSPTNPGQTSYSLQWQKTLSGDQILGVVQTPDGGFVGTGNSNGDAWIFKVDAARNLVWEKSVGRPKVSDMGWSVVATSDGGFVVAGYTQNLTSGWPSDLDGYIFKVDANGNVLWQQVYGTSATDQLFNIIATPDGGFMAAGYTQGGDRDVTDYHGGSSDMWLLKLDASGNKVWSKTFGGPGSEGPSYVRATTDGGYILAGSSSSSGGDIPANKGNYDFVVFKLDANGNKVWVKNYGGSGDEELNNIITTADGGSLLMGSTDTQDGDVKGIIKGITDAWIVKLDKNGQIQWQKTAGGSDQDEMWCGVAISDGNYMLGGETFSSDGDVTENKGGRDFWLIKLDGNGGLVWQKTFGGTAEDGTECVISTADGGFVASGFVNAINGDASGTGSGSWMFEIK